MNWLLIGLVVGAFFGFLAYGSAAGRFKMRWYQWLLALAAAALYVLTMQNYLGFQDELEPGVANLMLMLLGVPAVILTALIWIVPMMFGAIGRGKSSQ